MIKAWKVGRIGASKAAYCTALFPLVALSLSTLFEGYEWTWLSVLGVALVLAGNLRVFGVPVIVKRCYHAVITK
nr:EamA family transporter [Vibrio campbellii]